MKKDGITVEIHDIEGKEAAIVLDIARPHQIGLVVLSPAKDGPIPHQNRDPLIGFLRMQKEEDKFSFHNRPFWTVMENDSL